MSESLAEQILTMDVPDAPFSEPDLNQAWRLGRVSAKTQAAELVLPLQKRVEELESENARQIEEQRSLVDHLDKAVPGWRNTFVG